VRFCCWCFAVLATSFVPALVSAEEKQKPVSSEPLFQALRVDGGTYTGRVGSISPESITIITPENDETLELKLRDVVNVSRALLPPPPSTDGSHVLLAEGDRLMHVIVGETTETAINVQCHSSLSKLSIPLECVLALLLSGPAESESFQLFWDRIGNEPRSTEVVWMTNGDRLVGGFLGMNDHVIKFQVEGKSIDVDRTGVTAVGFDPATMNYPRPPSSFLDVTLTDGSRLGLTGTHIEKGLLIASTRFGQEVRVPLGEIVRIEPRTERIHYLSERRPDAVNYVSYVGPTRPVRVDRSVDGHRFQLSGRFYDRGLGMQSRTLVAYKLKPGDRRFQALVGLDDRAGPLGSVVFRVLLDGKPQLTTRQLGSRDTPVAIDVDLSKAKLLILITEFGNRGDVRDLADWVEARIIRD
jgi:hypothetical protein